MLRRLHTVSYYTSVVLKSITDRHVYQAVMATRTVKLRLHVPRNDDTAHRKVLWTTHQVLNEAAAYYEGYLLQMRQAEYETADGLVSKESVAENLKATVQTAQ